MAEQALTERLDDGVEVEATPRGGLSGKKLILFIVLPVVLLIATGAGLFFSGVVDSLLAEHSATERAEGEPQVMTGPGVYFDLPDMLVNLAGSSRGASFLKLSLSLELKAEEDKEQLKNVMPRIIDSFQVYLRELETGDLTGSAGLQRLREELLIRVNAVARPTEVRDVLFKEMLVQ